MMQLEGGHGPLGSFLGGVHESNTFHSCFANGHRFIELGLSRIFWV